MVEHVVALVNMLVGISLLSNISVGRVVGHSACDSMVQIPSVEVDLYMLSYIFIDYHFFLP